MIRVAPEMYDAMMTFLMEWEHRFPDLQRSEVQSLTRYGSAFPQEQAEAFLQLCIESGWRSSVSRVPQTEAWELFLDAHNESPFNELSGFVSWYNPKT
jgi:hypothetical protein